MPQVLCDSSLPYLAGRIAECCMERRRRNLHYRVREAELSRHKLVFVDRQGVYTDAGSVLAFVFTGDRFSKQHPYCRSLSAESSSSCPRCKHFRWSPKQPARTAATISLKHFSIVASFFESYRVVEATRDGFKPWQLVHVVNGDRRARIITLPCSELTAFPLRVCMHLG